MTDIFFSVRKGYEFLADEMVDYAVSAMPNFEGKQRLVLFNGQEYLKEAAAKRGFILTENTRTDILTSGTNSIIRCQRAITS